METAIIALSMITLLSSPVVAYGVMWLTSWERSGDRPEPPETNHSRRTIPGHGSDR